MKKSTLSTKKTTPAKKKVPVKPPAKTVPASGAAKPAAKATKPVKTAASAVSKPAPPAKASSTAAPAKAPAAKPAPPSTRAGPAPANTAKTASRPLTKTASDSQPAATKASAKPAAQTATPPSVQPAAPPAPTPPPAPVVAAPALPHGFIPRKAGKGGPKIVVPPVQAPLPPPTSRFADRFAPPRPPTRQMNKIESDTPRQPVKADPKLANAWKSKAGKELSDAEILAMPESEYMGDKQTEFFRVKLVALKDDLLTNAGETTEHLREDTTIVPDPADRATIEEEHALELRTRDRERKLLKKITQSLSRLESGEYGFCDETGEPIGLGRLIARPTATLSLEAQQRRELKQKLFGD